MLGRKELISSALIALLMISVTVNFAYAQNPEELIRAVYMPVRDALQTLGAIVVMMAGLSVVFYFLRGVIERTIPTVARSQAFRYFVTGTEICVVIVAVVLGLNVLPYIITERTVGPQAATMVRTIVQIADDILFGKFYAIPGVAARDFTIEYAYLTNKTLMVAIRNTGGTEISSATIAVSGLTLDQNSFTNLALGSGEGKPLETGVSGAEVDRTYHIVVTVTFKDGGETSHSIDVPCVG